MGYKVLSLFDGMSCGQLALTKLGITLDKYYASEVDKYAITVAQENYPTTIQLGSIMGWRDWDIDWSTIDLLLGGSPCQGFSSAGKHGGTKAVLDGEEFIVDTLDMYLYFKEKGAEFLSQSFLFWEYMCCLNHIKAHNPDVKFLLENVKMSKSNLDMISNALGVDPIFINSASVSAHNRQRFYWCNWGVPEPEDKDILMEDIVEAGYYSTRDKSYCLDANYGKGTNFRRYFFCGSRQLVLQEGYAPLGLTKETANSIMHEDGNLWRKLTVLECERLQTVPEGYVDKISIPKTEKYKVLGNGWTVAVISHILSFIPSD